MISPGSHIAVIFASLIVSASGDLVATDRQFAQRLSVVRLKFGASERETWITAINNDSVERLALMVDQYDPEQFARVTGGNGKSALMVACKLGSLALAKSLVAAGADVNAQTQTQGTAFMYAVLGGNLDIARWLVDHDANIHTAGSNGWTAMTIAAAKGYTGILEWLISQGADAQVRDVYRYTPLLRAVENGFEDVAGMLLLLPDTDVNARDENDNTALHHAVAAKNESMIKLLISHAADPDIANRSGVTPNKMAQELHMRHLLVDD
jgi:ankyrin repeat protein